MNLDRIDELLSTPYTANESMRYWRGAPVAKSAELDRIKALPRRALNVEDPTTAAIWTRLLRRDNAYSTRCQCTGKGCESNPKCRCWQTWKEPCLMHLRPVQGWALQEAFEHGGMIGSIGVGKGKTGVDILLPMVIPGVQTAVVFVPSSLRAQFLGDWWRWAEHFNVPNLVGASAFHPVPGRPRVHLVPYSTLSQTVNTDLLSRINPDLIIGDEAQSLKNPTAARTDRFMRAFRKPPGMPAQEVFTPPRYACHSGTFTTKSPRDFAHHCAIALRDGSPLPLDTKVLDEFTSALGELPGANAHPGELLTIATHAELTELRRLMGDNETDIARLIFAQRFRETPGVVVTIDGKPRLGEGPDEGKAIDLILTERACTLPDVPIDLPGLQPRLRGKTLQEIIEDVRRTWERPDGEELVEVIEFVRCVRELASGLFYKWRFPRKEAPEVIDLWFTRRKAWGKELRGYLTNPQPYADSEYWATRAAMRWHLGYEHEGKRYDPFTRKGPLPVFESGAFLPWLEVRDTVHPEPAHVWLHPFLVDNAVEWLKAHPTKGIVWYEHVAFGQELYRRAKQAGLNVPLYTGGDAANEQIREEDGTRSIIASIKAHGTGKNLQRFEYGLIGNPPSDGAAWEQLLGRWHRDGQRAPRVFGEVYRHTREYREAIDSAIGKANYIEKMTGSEQRLCYASVGWEADW